MTQGNPDLEWEKADQYDVGTDLSFFDGALTFTADAFLKDTRNLLYSKPVAATTGFTNYTCNIGSMRNRGLEFAVGGNLGKHDFHWKGDFNISFVRNRLTSLIGDDEILRTDDYHALKVGEEVGSFYMIKMTGIYQNDEEVPTYLYENYGVRAGDCIYEDVGGPAGEPDGDISSAYDSQFVGSPNPKLTGGLNNSFTYKGFDFNVFFTFLRRQAVRVLDRRPAARKRQLARARVGGPGPLDRPWHDEHHASCHLWLYLELHDVQEHAFPARRLLSASAECLSGLHASENAYAPDWRGQAPRLCPG